MLALPAVGGAAEPALQPDIISAFIRMVSVLACIIAVMLALAAVLKKMNIFRRPILGDKRFIQIIETVYFGPKQSIALVRAGNDFVLLGLSQQQISFLSKIDIGPAPKGCVEATDKKDFEKILTQAASAATLERQSLQMPAAENAIFEKKGFLQRAISKITISRIGDHGWNR